MQEWVSSVGWRVRWKARPALPRTQDKLEHIGKNQYLSAVPWAGWHGRCKNSQASEASRCLSEAHFFASPSGVYRASQEQTEDGCIKVTPSLLLEVLSSCMLLPFAQTVMSNSDPSLARGSVAEAAEFCRTPRSRVSCHGRRLAGRRGTSCSSLGGRVTKVTPGLSTVVVRCFPDQRLSRELWVVFVWCPLFSCSFSLLLVPPRLSRELRGLLAVAGRRFVVAAHAEVAF